MDKKAEYIVPRTYAPQLAVAENDLNARRDYKGPLCGPHCLKESLEKEKQH